MDFLLYKCANTSGFASYFKMICDIVIHVVFDGIHVQAMILSYRLLVKLVNLT